MELLQEENARLKIENALLIRLLLERKNHNAMNEGQKEGILFVDFYRLWLSHKRATLQPGTLFEYNRVFENYIIPYFSPKRKFLAEISKTDIEEYYRHLQSSRGMSNNTLIHHHANLHSCIKYAYEENFVSSMVMDKVKRPKEDPKKNFNYYTVDELLELLALAKGGNILMPILLASILGLSRSEALALKWEAINFHAGTVSVVRKMTRDKAKAKDTLSRNLKTHARRRTLALPEFLLAYLKQQRAGTAYLPNKEYAEFVCVDSNGKLPTLNMITNRFRSFLQNQGLKKIRFHDLRHSCATMLQSLGYSMKDIQEWLGHSNFQTTANIYTHVNMEEKKKIAQRLNEVLGNFLELPQSTADNQMEE